MYIPLRIASGPAELGEAELRAYMKRIGALDAFLSVGDHLGHLQQRHLLSIPYENFDALAGIPPATEERRLWEKLVPIPKRGGSGFELNRLFLWLLRRLRFDAVPVAVTVSDEDALMVMVLVEGVGYLVDVGHDLPSVAPLPLLDGGELTGRVSRLRTLADGDGRWRIEQAVEGGWREICRLATRPLDENDLRDLAASTHERELARAGRSGVRAAIAMEDGTAILEGDVLRVMRGGEVRSSRLDEARRERFLEHLFELDPSALPRA